jgi:hypothetical protein
MVLRKKYIHEMAQVSSFDSIELWV